MFGQNNVNQQRQAGYIPSNCPKPFGCVPPSTSPFSFSIVRLDNQSNSSPFSFSGEKADSRQPTPMTTIFGTTSVFPNVTTSVCQNAIDGSEPLYIFKDGKIQKIMSTQDCSETKNCYFDEGKTYINLFTTTDHGDSVTYWRKQADGSTSQIILKKMDNSSDDKTFKTMFFQIGHVPSFPIFVYKWTQPAAGFVFEKDPENKFSEISCVQASKSKNLF